MNRKVHMMTLYLLFMTLFYRWDPSTATPMKEVSGPPKWLR